MNKKLPLLLVVALAASAFADDKPVITGTAAQSDYTADSPGTSREIKVADLPPPYIWLRGRSNTSSC